MSFINISNDFSSFLNNNIFTEKLQQCVDCILLFLNQRYHNPYLNQHNNNNNNQYDDTIQQQFHSFQMEALPKCNSDNFLSLLFLLIIICLVYDHYSEESKIKFIELNEGNDQPVSPSHSSVYLIHTLANIFSQSPSSIQVIPHITSFHLIY